MGLRAIAVPAQNLEPRRVPSPFEPTVNAGHIAKLFFDLPSVLRPVVIDVVNGEKLQLGLSAASTNGPSVSFKCCKSEVF